MPTKKLCRRFVRNDPGEGTQRCLLRDGHEGKCAGPSRSEWPTEDQPGIAVIAPTGYGTFGIWWSRFPAMERRGGYSGPYRTVEEARDGVKAWADHWESPVRVEVRDQKPEKEA